MAFTFEGHVVLQTARAIRFQSHYWGGALWFPLSQIEMKPDGEMGTIIVVKDWLCNKRDLKEFHEYTEEEIECLDAAN